jgi:predicted aspartyl protease
MKEKNELQVYALTISSGEGIKNVITTPVEIAHLISNHTIKTQGIWDTGATGSVITKSVASALGLVPVNSTLVHGVHGVKEVNVYFVKITLHNKNITLNALVTECEELSADNSVGMLIGMNIINMGDFAITNYQGQTTMSFRVPSIQVIDFVKGLKSGIHIVKDKIPGRNDPCPCGSGKKYKHCCGK